MARYHATVQSRRPAQDTFDYLATFSNAAQCAQQAGISPDLSLYMESEPGGRGHRGTERPFAPARGG